jgi:hypothetical protein
MWCRSSQPGSAAVPIKPGRPDFLKMFQELDCENDTRSIGIWTAGPKAFNLAVADAAYGCGHKVLVDQMAFEL